MKKVLVLLLFCLSSTVMFAEHWQYNAGNGTPMTMTGLLFINGVEVGEEALNYEIGFFDVDGICRAAKLPKLKNGHYRYSPTIHGLPENQGTAYTCRVWDHVNDCELECSFVPDATDPLIYIPGKKWGSSGEPYPLNFSMGATGYTLDINCYDGEKDNYYLIASPVTVGPDAVENMVAPYAYDLFYFDQAGDDEGKEWITYKEGGTDSGFGLVPGKGYLYANAGDAENRTVTLTFPAGNEYEGDGAFELDYFEGDWAGWNLMGNPYMETAYIDRPFYVMNQQTGEVMPSEESGIAQMQGIFVEATGADDVLTFTTEEPGKVSKLSLNLVSGNSLVDRAIVNFGGGSLSKFQINSSSTKLYIPMDGEDYAVVSSAEMGEVPVSFKAAKSGSYTLAVSTEVSFNYLHLIDNLTGADQDLLANPSYSFEASVTDYASRFRLVFATGDSDDTFAFYSNGSFVISNEGEATVQVVDVTGRVLSSEAISGSASVSVSGAAGVYMIRLVNGESVKVQKVVVK